MIDWGEFGDRSEDTTRPDVPAAREAKARGRQRAWERLGVRAAYLGGYGFFLTAAVFALIRHDDWVTPLVIATVCGALFVEAL